MKRLLLILILSVSVSAEAARVADPKAAARGYHNLFFTGESSVTFPSWLAKPDVFDHIWKGWEPELKKQAKAMTSLERRKAAFKRYGLIERTDSPLPIGFIQNKSGQIGFNCMVCHAGIVAGQVVNGLTNSKLDLRTFVEDLSRTGAIKFPAVALASFFPEERGVTNALSDIALALALRDSDMDLKLIPKLSGNFTEALASPPIWWLVKKKNRLLADGFYPVNERIFAVIASSPFDSGERFRSELPNLSDIVQYVQSVPVPAYPGRIDSVLAAEGKPVYLKQCASCHGTYEPGAHVYNDSIVLASEVGTDPERATSPRIRNFREQVMTSWLAKPTQDQVILDPGGYTPGPLDGVWATGPYLHNGSVPTLYDLLTPSKRPAIWKAHDTEYDLEKLGPRYESFASVPKEKFRFQRRKYYDTSKKGRGAQGHTYGQSLSEVDKARLLEYLKTL